MNLSHLFSDEEKLKSFNNQFTPGRVLYLFCNFTQPPKEKYLLIASTNPLILMFVINSEINQFKTRKPHLLNAQLPISVIDHKFLDHDSFIDCSQVVSQNDFSLKEIHSQVLKDMSRIKGTISQLLAQQIISVVNNSRTLVKDEINAITTSFNNY